MTRNKTHASVLAILKRTLPVLGIAGATLMPAACKKPLVQHDTTYTWGANNWDTETMQHNLVASADSAEVRYVYMLNDGESFTGLPLTPLFKVINDAISAVPKENLHKIRGAGELTEVSMKKNDPEYMRDSTALANLGFKFKRVLYVNYR